MHIFTFVIDYWSDILVILLLLILTLIGIHHWLKILIRASRRMPVKEKIAYTTRLLANLVPMVAVLKTEAFRKYGPDDEAGKNSILYRAYLIDELYKRVPDEYKKYISIENLDAIIAGANRTDEI